jgi:hypothetical protein
MNYKRFSNSLRKIANKILTQDDLEQRIIIQKGNTYHAYGTYTIEETQCGWKVISVVCDDPLFFNTAKVALTWCILDKYGRYKLTTLLEWLDSRVTAKQNDIDVLTYTLENAKQIDNRAVLLARLTEDINSRQMYKKQLSKCTLSAKYIKLKGTNNAINRSHKTSRRKHRR